MTTQTFTIRVSSNSHARTQNTHVQGQRKCVCVPPHNKFTILHVYTSSSSHVHKHAMSALRCSVSVSCCITPSANLSWLAAAVHDLRRLSCACTSRHVTCTSHAHRVTSNTDMAMCTRTGLHAYIHTTQYPYISLYICMCHSRCTDLYGLPEI